ncbi:beta-galactosidase [Leifsonia sp. 21MFCrub1.1]|uniref:beta-galactosidase n=1 Tax=Leifsonia sp. 21MFCrub1.1 TaxID=1798223 RepID=UPI0008927C64|nr:beta-galactosidase [Leifsonia sp. 21MFCrub1.1]SEB08449.1 beta-galactosidase [Leifsonia sp. 21MFCrub1.1]
MRPLFTDSPWFGGDYNPEQWPEAVWDEDVELMRRAGVNLVTVGVFAWSLLEPEEGRYEFAWLDDVLDLLHENGVKVDLATATAAPPPWLSHRYPESLPVTADGVRLSPGSRQGYCPSSPAYRRSAARLTRALAERYGTHPAVVMWHVNNEYGCHVSRCYCDESAAAFRRWLTAKYETVGALNEAWGTAFWSQSYSTFDEILPPRATPAYPNPTQSLDFERFSSDEMLACFLEEKAILREVTPDIPVTTNFMGLFRGADYWRWAEHVDVVSDDLYPDPADPDAARGSALARDLMRSLGRGRPWILMEQSPSAVNTRPANAPKAPGQMRALSYQALARGADGILFFQWRQSASGAEKFHSAMVPHAGTDTRIWREVEQLGAELGTLGHLMGSRVKAQAALVFDWDSWWAIEQQGLPATSSYRTLVARWHAALTEAGLTVDLTRGDEDLTGYAIVIVPSLFVTTDAQAAAIDEAARAGATVLVTDQTGIVDENLRVRLGGYLGELQSTLGVWIEEFWPLAGAWARPGAIPVSPESTVAPTVSVRGPVFDDGVATGIEWTEVVHVREAHVLAVFDGGQLGGWPALTRNVRGDGTAWYLSTRLERDGTAAIVRRLISESGLEVRRPVSDSDAGFVESLQRGEAQFVINHGATAVTLAGKGTDLLTGGDALGLTLEPQGVAVIGSRAVIDQDVSSGNLFGRVESSIIQRTSAPAVSKPEQVEVVVGDEASLGGVTRIIRKAQDID